MHSRIVCHGLGVVALCAACSVVRAQPHAPAAAVLGLDERVVLATKIYSHVVTFFPDLDRPRFDAAYASYVARIARSEHRRDFDLASIELLASLQDGHTWFADPWLDDVAGQPVGFTAYPLDGKWTVMSSRRDALRPGAVVTALDGVSLDAVLARERKLVSASSDREAAVDLFDTAVAFPARFRLTLADGRSAVIDREAALPAAPAPHATGRWLTTGTLAYLALPTFHGLAIQVEAVDWLRRFHDARAIIIDVRGNRGGGYPSEVVRAVMTAPYVDWTHISATRGGGQVRILAGAFARNATTTSGGAVIPPREPVFAGRLIVLTDRACASGCEDFVMPLATARRAMLVGEATAGTFSDTARLAFDNGMLLNVTAVRKVFPDGRRFEGVGIAPDVAVAMSPEDLAGGRDPVLRRAIELAGP